MAYAGGDPDALAATSTQLGGLAGDLAGDAVAVKGQGGAAAAAVGDGGLAALAETALAAVGGAVVATSTLVAGLSRAASTAGDQLDVATGGSR